MPDCQRWFVSSGALLLFLALLQISLNQAALALTPSIVLVSSTFSLLDNATSTTNINSSTSSLLHPIRNAAKSTKSKQASGDHDANRSTTANRKRKKPEKQTVSEPSEPVESTALITSKKKKKKKTGNDDTKTGTDETNKSNTPSKVLTRDRRNQTTRTAMAKTALKSDTVRRIQREWKDLVEAGMGYDWKNQRPLRSSTKKSTNSTRSDQQHGRQQQHVWIGPLSRSNLYVWHFSFVGVPGSPYENGIYHGRMVLPKNYPASPPKVQVWTPSGRFQTRTDLCLSASHFHPETWTASWTISTLTQALRLHMLTTANEIGGILSCPFREKQSYARQSHLWQAVVGMGKGKVSGEIEPIVVDHAKMLQDSLFPIESGNNDKDDSQREGRSADHDQEQRQRQPPLEDQQISSSFRSDLNLATQLQIKDGSDEIQTEPYYDPRLGSQSSTGVARVVKSSSTTTHKSLLEVARRIVGSPTRLAIWCLLILFLWLNHR